MNHEKAIHEIGERFMNTSIPSIIICVDDMESSIRLYRDLLGLPCRKTGNRWSEFNAGKFRLGLHIQDSGAQDKASGVVVLCIEVADLDGTCRRLENTGYQVEGPEVIQGLGRLATLRDPDDVALSLS